MDDHILVRERIRRPWPTVDPPWRIAQAGECGDRGSVIRVGEILDQEVDGAEELKHHNGPPPGHWSGRHTPSAPHPFDPEL